MYKTFFGLRENPFNVNPDPRFLFRTQAIEESLASLAYGIRARKGFILLTGEVGTGKTTLLNKLLDWLHQQQIATAFIFNTHVKVSHLFDFILADFGIPCESREKSQMLMALSRWLLDRYRAGEAAVLVIDEAQNLSQRVLEEIRLLTNLETSTEKLLQIVLSGQPELEEKLRRPELRQLKQRITLRCKTMPLSLEETSGYVLERLRVAGANGEPIFSPEALEGIHRWSRGIPRVINLICEHALINAYAESTKPVPGRLISEVVREFQLEETPGGLGGALSGELPRPELLQDLAQFLERYRERASFPADSGEKTQ
jgi:putative secretion ATPase (PEP-CTERM system associated)